MSASKKPVLVTGSAGFIGYHLTHELIRQGHPVVGLDNLCSYYDPRLKEARNDQLKSTGQYQFVLGDLADARAVSDLFEKHTFAQVFHLGAQAGVRYSIDHPEIYLKSNIDGTHHILEACRHAKNKPQLLLASSSSVYGLSNRLPFREDDPADQPVSLYGVTKRSNELMAFSYAHLFGLNITALRFFTVYGPWGRPDMALFKFVKPILAGEPIEVYNNGDMVRDFTYVDDVVRGTLALAQARSQPGQPGYDVFNIGCGTPRTLSEFIQAIESATGRSAQIQNLPFQPGDVHKTFADTAKLQKLTGFKPQVSVEEAVSRFVAWYREYYRA